jgi:hypothetical protein
MSSPEKTLRQQLLKARADVRRQIEILESSLEHGRDAGVMFGPVITDLTATLKEIEDSLADLEAHDA